MLSVSQNKESPVHGPYVVSVNSCISFAEPRNSVGYCVRIIQVYVQTVSLYRQNKQKSLCNKCNYEAVLLLDIITSHIGQLYGNLHGRTVVLLRSCSTTFALSKLGKCFIVQVVINRSRRIHTLCLRLLKNAFPAQLCNRDLCPTSFMKAKQEFLFHQSVSC